MVWPFCVTLVSIVANRLRVLSHPYQGRMSSFEGFVWPVPASLEFIWRFCRDIVSLNFNRTSVGAYRIRPEVSENARNIHPTTPRFQSNKCRGVSHTPWCEQKRKKRTTHQTQDFNRTSVGAYRIRPEVSENARNTNPSTPRFQPNKCRGVSHTPSRERKWNRHIPQSIQDFNRTGVGAYRIRPDVGENETNTQSNKSRNSTGQRYLLIVFI